jgi:glycosyltransferase involved in cell wall biosynthesis
MGVDICVFAATEDTEIAAELTANSTGLEIKIIPIRDYIPHIEVLKLQASARCYVGLSISDGISTSMLEAMAMGAFPIQTCTSCANEWIENGVSGFIAPYEDEHTLAGLILEAMTNDTMVDNAAEINWQTLQNKARYEDVQAVARSFYKTAYDFESEKFSGF